jgi:hypothetical protein
MGDKKYVKLNPDKMGFEYLGMLAPKRQTLLVDAFESVKKDLGADWNARIEAKEIFWINLWQDPDDIDEDSDITPVSDREIADALDTWCRKAARKYCERNAIIDGYGFVVNPKGTGQYQPWHIDYTTDAAALLIPLTPLTDRNATQFITLPYDTPEGILEQLASDVDDVDVDALIRTLDCVGVHQLIGKPMSIFYMGRGTIHRGIPNGGNDDRVIFFISVHFIKNYERSYPYEHESLEGVAETGIATFAKTR